MDRGRAVWAGALALACSCGGGARGGDAADTGTQAGGLFYDARDYSTTQNPRSMAAADFDGDGALDLAVASSNDAEGVGAVRILLGDGAGGFVQGNEYGVYDPWSVTAGDFNGDDHADFAAVPFDGMPPSSIVLYTGSGDGTFEETQIEGDRFLSGEVTALDVNGDDYDDLAASFFPGGDADFVSSGVEILLGPDFSERHEVAFPTPPAGAGIYGAQVTGGDFNEDGHVDLVTAAGLFLGDGSGEFGERIPYAAEDVPTWLRVADVDSDGHQDVVFSPRAPRIDVMRGDGSGQLGRAWRYEVANRDPRAIAAADFDGDGNLDLAVGSYDRNLQVTDSVVSILMRTENSSFAYPVIARVSTGSADALIAADLNGDGLPDLVGTNTSFASVSVLLHTP